MKSRIAGSVRRARLHCAREKIKHSRQHNHPGKQENQAPQFVERARSEFISGKLGKSKARIFVHDVSPLSLIDTDTSRMNLFPSNFRPGPLA
jgi:hypothetical protein